MEILVMNIFMIRILLGFMRYFNNFCNNIMVDWCELDMRLDNQMMISVRMMNLFVHGMMRYLMMVVWNVLSKAVLWGHFWPKVLADSSKTMHVIWIKDNSILIITYWMVSLMLISLVESMLLIITEHSMTMIGMWISMWPRRFTHRRSPEWCMVVKWLSTVMVIVFHGQDKFAICNFNLTCPENCAICIKSGIVRFVPLACVKSIKVIFPMEIKPVCVMIVCIGFNEIKF